MRNITLLIVISCCVALFFMACTKNATEPTESRVSEDDRSIIAEIIDSDDFFRKDDVLLNDGSPSLGKYTALLSVVRWGRKIDSVQRTKEYEMLNDTTVEVIVRTKWSGKIWIHIMRENKPDTIITKPFVEEIQRKVWFVKNDTARVRKNRWRFHSISALKGGTLNAQNVTILKVVFYTDGDSIEINDPLSYTFVAGTGGRYRLRTFAQSLSRTFKIQVTVRSNDPSSDLVVAHRPVVLNNSWSYRAPMEQVSSMSNNDGTFTRVYEHTWRGAWQGHHHVMVGAIPRSAVYDDATPFSSQLWGIPFIVQ
ncbi:MAG: hypothetical protein N3A63_01195 [Bacteroidetes bacterium]|nr:hypothetical protein [Bacteroidota bacterium]